MVKITLFTSNFCPSAWVRITAQEVKDESSSCKQIISVVILKGNIPIQNVQTCSDGFFLSHKIMQSNGASLFQNIVPMFWFEHSFGWEFLFVESYLQDSCWFIIMVTIASKRKLNTESIKDKYSALKEVEDGKQSRKSLQSTAYQRALYLLG